MTTTNRAFEEMMQAYQQTAELPRRTTTIATELKKAVDAEFKSIDSDPLYSPAGKMAERDVMRKHYGKMFIVEAKKLRDEYDKAVVQVKTRAEVLLNEDPPKPDAITLKSFQRGLDELKMDVMLSVDSAAAVRKIDDFASKQSNPYFAKQIMTEFSGMASNIIAGSNNSGQVKQKLRDTFDSVKNKAFTDEQKKAQEIAGYMEDKFGRNLFLPSSIEMSAIERSVGPEFTRFANNPHSFPSDSE